jgi:hypothetical protein
VEVINLLFPPLLAQDDKHFGNLPLCAGKTAFSVCLNFRYLNPSSRSLLNSCFTSRTTARCLTIAVAVLVWSGDALFVFLHLVPCVRERGGGGGGGGVRSPFSFFKVSGKSPELKGLRSCVEWIGPPAFYRSFSFL